MEMDNAWLEHGPLKKLCDQVRRSLSEATKFQGELSQTKTKLHFDCGVAIYSEKHNGWILRHRVRTLVPASMPRRRDSLVFDSLSVAGSPHNGTSKSLPVTNARRVAGVYPSDQAKLQFSGTGGSRNAVAITPPVLLFEQTFRAIELRSMFEQVQLSLTKDPPGSPHCHSRLGTKQIDFGPIISKAGDDFRRNGRDADQHTVLQTAIQLCSAFSHRCDLWVVEVDPVDESKAQQKISSVPGILQRFIRYCLKEDTLSLAMEPSQDSENPRTGDASATAVPVARGSQLAGEQSAPTLSYSSVAPLHSAMRVTSSFQQPGQPSTAINESLTNVSCSTHRKDNVGPARNANEQNGCFLPNDRDISHGELTKSQRIEALPEEKHSIATNWEERESYIPEKRASKRRKVQTSNFNEETLTGEICSVLSPLSPGRKDCDVSTMPLRRSKRTAPARWVEDKTTPTSESSPDATADLKVAEDTKQAAASKFNSGRGDIATNLEQPDRKRSRERSRDPEEACKDADFSFVLPTQSSEWVKLSHLGHMSDYTGFQRKYDSFLPLKYSQTLDEMSKSIENTLKEHNFQEFDESDDEILAENLQLSRIMSNYTAHAELERSRKHASTQVNRAVDSESELITRPILFGVDSKASPKACPSVKCPLCYPGVHVEANHSPTKNAGFREVEFDMLHFDEKEGKSGHDKKARWNRSKEIAAQRKTSLLMLNDLRHKFEFVSQYNRGLGPKSAGPGTPVGVAGESSLTSPGNEIHPNEAIAVGGQSKKKRSYDASTSSPVRGDLTLPGTSLPVQLSYDGILEEFQVLTRRKIMKIASLQGNVTPDAVKECISEILHENPFTEVDDEVQEEHKTYQRAIRTYSGKADQERIEKREHEEERALQLRELEYKSRGKKPSAEEVELASFECRPMLFSPPKGRTSVCKFGKSCTICDNDSEVCANGGASVIFHPSYKKVDHNYFVANPESTSRPSRTLERSCQKEQAMEDLRMLQQRLEFVEQYNTGFLVAKGRRK